MYKKKKKIFYQLAVEKNLKKLTFVQVLDTLTHYFSKNLTFQTTFQYDHKKNFHFIGLPIPLKMDMTEAAAEVTIPEAASSNEAPRKNFPEEGGGKNSGTGPWLI